VKRKAASGYAIATYRMPPLGSGLYFHPESRYFSLGKIDRHPVADHSKSKGMSAPEVERWLGQNLNYDLAE
jgi:5-methyltetrahydrofolate--homocysteine methyltransferase